jgi:carboxylate-amine ligase
MMVRQNKWRASRYGLDALLIDPLTFEPQSVQRITENLVQRLRPIAEELQCTHWLERLIKLSHGPGWADRQLAALHKAASPAEVVRQFTAESRISPAPV